MNKSELDVAALESVSFAKNYNNYVFNLILGSIKGKRIIDFGAGYGNFSVFLQSNDKEVVAIEVNKEAIHKLNELNIPNYKNLDELKEKYNTVVSLNVLEHIDDDLSVLKELIDYIENSGKIILYLPASEIIWSELDELVNHKRRYSRKLIKNLAMNSELKIDQIISVDFIGWMVVFLSKALRIKLDFSKNKIIFYDKFIFKNFKYLDLVFKRIIGKNLLIVLSKK
tara:strand:+ start:791 stop:1468 length:678 start_codon:yes stop_codon:yes gene_type:complete